MERDDMISYRDVIETKKMTPEEREELEKKLKEESDQLTDWPKM